MGKGEGMGKIDILPSLLKDGSYQATALDFFCKVWLVAFTMVLGVLMASQPELRLRWLTAELVSIVVVALPIGLKKAGHLRLALAALPFFSWLAITMFAWSAGGITASGVFTYIPVAIIASILAGKRWGTFILVLTFLALLAFALLETWHLLPTNVVATPPIVRLVYYLTPLILTWSIHYYTSSQIHPTFDKAFVVEEQRKAVEAEKEMAFEQLNDRVKELQTLFAVAQMLQNDDKPLPEILQEFVNVMPRGWQHSDVAEAKLTLDGQIYQTEHFRPSDHCQYAEGETASGQKVSLSVVYLEPKQQMIEGPFLAEERELINALGKMLTIYLDKRHVLEALRKSEANLHTVFNTTHVAYTLVDESLHILSQNKAAQQFGQKEFGVLVSPGDHISNYIKRDKEWKLDQIMEKVLHGEAMRYQVSYEQPNAESNWYSVGYFPIIKDNGGVWGFLVEIKDITQTKQAELALQNINENLEVKVAERTKELVELNKDLEAFSYSVSHDLKSPLRAISGYSAIMLKRYNDKIDEDVLMFIKSISESAQQMNDLIDGLLQFSLLGKSSLSISDVSMQMLVSDVLRETGQTYSHIPFTVVCGEIPVARGDAKLLRQAWANIISNAIKYSGKKAAPSVEIGSFNENGNTVFYVKDNGDGFDMKYANKLFQIFNRLHTSSEFEGSGIGLATVHRILSKHGGSIWAESVKGEGATFYFTVG